MGIWGGGKKENWALKNNNEQQKHLKCPYFTGKNEKKKNSVKST